MDIWSTWWVWIAAALGLAILETLAPGFVFLGFAVGVGLVGLLLLVPGASSLSLSVLLLIAAGLSLLAWLTFRRLFALPGAKRKTFNHDIND